MCKCNYAISLWFSHGIWNFVLCIESVCHLCIVQARKGCNFTRMLMRGLTTMTSKNCSSYDFSGDNNLTHVATHWKILSLNFAIKGIRRSKTESHCYYMCMRIYWDGWKSALSKSYSIDFQSYVWHSNYDSVCALF